MFAGALVLSALAVLTVDPQQAQAACATGSSVHVTNPSTTTATGPLSGLVTLSAASTPTSASGLTFMILPTQQAIGEAVLSGTSWNLSWDSRNLANGSYQLMAIAHFGSATSLDCASPVVPLTVNNVATQSPKLAGVISPATWQGPAGTSAPFTVDTLYTDQYGRQSHVSPTGVNWHSTLGTAAPNGGSTTVFKAGTVLGTGTLLTDLGYNGIAGQASAALKVTAPGTATSTAPAPTPVPTPAPTPASLNSAAGTAAAPTPTPVPLTAADASRLAAMPTIFRPTAPTNADPIVSLPTLSCLEKAVGTVRFSEISSGKSQPTAAERNLAAACFSGPEPIPSVLAPIAPTHLTELATTTDIVSVGSIKNQTTTGKDGSKVNGLLITGKGAPNSNVFVYVFSDPLVLRAQTNSQGVWNYVLETPLKAGKHEVYAVAEKDAGNFVRTSAVPISVAAAAAGSQDGSLVVEKGWSAAQLGFAAGAAVMVIAAIGLLFALLRRRKRAGSPANDLNSAVTAPTVISPVIQVATPEPAASAPTDQPAPTPPAPTPTVFEPKPPVPVAAQPSPPAPPATASAPSTPSDTEPTSAATTPTPPSTEPTAPAPSTDPPAHDAQV